jgi:hypothetical protein
MTTICHIAERALQREMDFCSHAVTIVPGICLAQPRLLNKEVACLLTIARTNPMFKPPAGAPYPDAITRRPGSLAMIESEKNHPRRWRQ